MNITIDTKDLSAPMLASLQAKLADKSGLHARMAGEAERFIKDRGRVTSQTEHRTANRLGATPTGHLEKAYQQIESQSGKDSASLLVPRASRLRAAFGGYVVTPKKSQFLTIPYVAEAYGKRAGEFGNLEFSIELVNIPGRDATFMRVLKTKGGGAADVKYILVKKATIPEDAGLIPFEELSQQAADAAELYLLEESLI